MLRIAPPSFGSGRIEADITRQDQADPLDAEVAHAPGRLDTR